ncbi:Rab11 family-interacting protein 3 [Liparis tanakae]|uniref:Rab11 family-interacting protein 3 n=1 Tax=Liparis tanakae TaxID=230148 RepID=A0A4Z2F5Y4_9TELE|nr:Rab11 family-interacting protein 3 [Liparis tanakae]
MEPPGLPGLPGLPGPLGPAHRESEHGPPLGCHPLGSDNGGELCLNKGGQTGLDFRNEDQDQTLQQRERDNFHLDKPVELDNLLNISDFPGGGLPFDGDQFDDANAPLHGSPHISFTEKRPEELSDFSLSWLFSPKLPDAVEGSCGHEEPSLTREGRPEASRALSLGRPASPSEVSGGHSDTDTGDPFVLVDLSNGLSCLPPEASGELTPPGVSEELVDLSPEEEGGGEGAGRETLSRETRDEGLFPDQVTDLPLTWSAALPASPESRLPPNKVREPPERCAGSGPLLDSEVPDCGGGLSLRPAIPPAVTRADRPEPSGSSAEESGLQHAAAVNRRVTPERRGEDDSCALRLSAEAPSLTLAGDVFAQEGDLLPEPCAVQAESAGLMEDALCSGGTSQGNRTMALDLCAAAGEVHGEETLDVQPRAGVPDGRAPDPGADRGEEERETDGRAPDPGADRGEEERETDGRAPDPGADRGEEERATETGRHRGASFDFSVQDLHTTSPEAGRTREPTGESTSPAQMEAEDSLPMVSAVSAGEEEDVSPLKAVFDALDQDGDGFVRIEEFMEFAAAYGADQVRASPGCCSVNRLQTRK